ncbi:hypothetical protein F2P81_025517 [Scophthalmus maximus]|uniref:ribonuclease H n=1 Tax=Scophthalmus maximus TaxID=52904 RepID=A0A6A4RT96_SCOMX|nr:hypothetical protein F2P81_025517 [Scophthalmus maximus]
MEPERKRKVSAVWDHFDLISANKTVKEMVARKYKEERERVKMEVQQAVAAYKITSSASDSAVLQHDSLTRYHGREKTDHPAGEEVFKLLPPALWSTGPFDVGFCDVPPPLFLLDTKTPVYRPQYQNKPAAVAGLRDTIDRLLKSGVIEKSDSYWNTPLLPVPKADGLTYRMAHDLRVVNDVVRTPVAPVPNPFRALSVLNSEHRWFTVIDLANTFFCIPLAHHLRHPFAFTYAGQKYQYTRLPQGFSLSPGIFNSVLREQLNKLSLPPGTVLVQYVDDILLASPSESDALAAAQSVLQELASSGFNCSKNKLQFVRQCVSFLGRRLSAAGLAPSSTQLSSILNHARPQTVRDMMSFLGLCNYSRNYIPSYCDNTAILRRLILDKGVRNLTLPLDWSSEAEACFIQLKQLLAHSVDDDQYDSLSFDSAYVAASNDV